MRAAGAAVVALLLVLAGCEPARAPAVPPDHRSAGRIVTLAPHLAELVYAAGAGSQLVGVVAFSDYPPPVAALPRIGDAFRVDYEALLGLHPDVVLGWNSGNPPEVIERLRALGLRVEMFEPVTLDDIGAQIRAIGALAGTDPAAARAAAAYAGRLAGLAAPVRQVPLRVFVQLSERPFYTVTDRHFIGQGLRLCGGRSVFGELPGITAVVSLEAIVAAAPEVIIVSAAATRASLDEWRRWQTVPAVRDSRLYGIDADLLSRPGPRILDGIEQLCGVLNPR
jgi:iron complex transport system substrate-binding protein